MKKLILVMAVAHSNSQVSLGGIASGCSGDYVIQVYGTLDRKSTKREDGMTLTTYYYGSTVLLF